jgi:hypothetical protein
MRVSLACLILPACCTLNCEWALIPSANIHCHFSQESEHRTQKTRSKYVPRASSEGPSSQVPQHLLEQERERRLDKNNSGHDDLDLLVVCVLLCVWTDVRVRAPVPLPARCLSGPVHGSMLAWVRK